MLKKFRLFNNSSSEKRQLDLTMPLESSPSQNLGETHPQIPPPYATRPVLIRDPCLQAGLTVKAREPEYEENYNFTGTGNYFECKEALIPLLNLSIPCNVMPCSMNGVHQPTISYHNSQFYGFSEFWYTMEDVFRIGGLYEHEIFETHARVSIFPKLNVFG